MVDKGLDRNLGRDDIGRKGGAGATGSTMERETTGDKMKEGWNGFKAKVRQRWNTLTDNDLDRYQGRDRNEFVGFVGERVGGDRSAIERDVDNYARETNYRWNQ